MTRAQLAGKAESIPLDAASRAQLNWRQGEAVRTISAIDAAKATADRRAEITDSVLVAPMRARVQTRPIGPERFWVKGRVFSLADLGDVYMYVFS